MKTRRIKWIPGVWERWDDGWSTVIDDLFQVVTWPFGNIHQSKVFMDGEAVGICLPARRTEREAMEQGVAWVRKYQRRGPPTPKQLFRECYRSYATISQTRSSVLNRMFFATGTSFIWFDGAIVRRFVESPTERRNAMRRIMRSRRSRQRTLDRLEQAGHTDFVVGMRREMGDGDGAPASRLPLSDDGKPVAFSAIDDGYSNITIVPDDVRPEWLAVAYEAAQLLRDRSDFTGGAHPERSVEQSRNQEIGARVCAELLKRFPQLATK